MSNLVKICEDHSICIGTKPDLSSDLIIHSISKSSNYLSDNEENEEKPLNPYGSLTYYRKPDCSMLVKGEFKQDICPSCAELIHNSTKNHVRKLINF